VLDDFREFLAPTLELIENKKKEGRNQIVRPRMTKEEIVNPKQAVTNPRCLRSLHQDHILTKKEKDEL
jgi:hypothetical protein